MRVAVTGATGYLGAHTALALLEAGHAIDLLVPPHERDAPVLDRLRTRGTVSVLTGDLRDDAVVTGLLRDADAVLHAAGVVGTGDRDARLMWEINAYATECVLTRSVDLGLDPVVSVSSYSALFPPPAGVITPDTPTAAGRSAYAKTKAHADRVARRLQSSGAPVVTTYPSSVVGPPFHTAVGVTERGWQPLIRWGIAPRIRGGMQMVDVRDVGEVHARLMRPGRGPHRYLCGGVMVSFDEMVDALEQGSRRRIRRVGLAPGVFRTLGRIGDQVGRIHPLAEGLSLEAATLLTAAVPTDDSATLSELDMRWRSPTAAIVESVRAALHRGGQQLGDAPQ